MCGRFAFYSPAEATAALFGVEAAADVEARYNIAPTQYVAAVREAERGRELAMLKWGLVPFWAKDAAIGNRMINARAETVAEKPAFRAAYRHRRCLVLADGFYEWHADETGKTPYFISRVDGRPFAFAALWEHWRSKESDEEIQSTTIVTAQADAFMARLHQRMPVIVEPALAADWLGGSAAALAAAIDQTPALRAWPVSRTVNNPRNEGERLPVAQGETLTG